MNKLAGIAALIVTLVVALLAASQTHAGDIPKPVPARQLTGVFEPDPKGVWRTLAYTDSASTSDCIGDPVTAMCAVDTWIACGARMQDKFCDIAAGEPMNMGLSSKRDSDHFTDYRVVSSRYAKKEDIGPFPEYTTGDRRIGDVLISVISRYCTIFNKEKPYDNCVDEGMPRTYTLRQSGERWWVVHLHSPRY